MIRTVLDWETAYGKHPVTQENITLSKITTEHYARHPLFRVHGLGVKIEQDAAFYVYGEDLLHFLKTHLWEQTFAICHHAHFDGAIFSWRAGIRPAFWGDTLSMARAIYPHESCALGNISKLLGLGEKGIELANFAGKWSLTDQEQAVLGSYCKNDVELTARIFDALKGHFPVSELRLIDLTIRLFTEPVLQVDRGVLIEEYKRERRTKRALLKACAVGKAVLSSGDQFAQLLLTLGVDPPKKLSPSKVKDGRVNPDNAGEPPLGILPSFKLPEVLNSPAWTTREERTAEKARLKAEKDSYPWTYAFGKSDEEFAMLQDHPDEQVRAVVDARLGVKSTIKETRSKRFYKIGSRGAFPVYHNYYGARTGRDSGGDKQNTTNLNRVNPKDPTSGALRRSLCSPLGHVLTVRDLGQIEARKLAYWAGQEDLVNLFREGGDPYNRQASKIFGYEVNRKLDQFFLEGLVGKSSTLGNGYGMGWGKFQESLRVGFMGAPPVLFDQAAAQKLGADADVFCHMRSYKKGCATLREEALATKPLNVSVEAHLWHCAAVKQIVDKYRESNDAIVRLWRETGQALEAILQGEEIAVGHRGLITTCKEGFVLPNGMKIRYHKLRKNDSGEFRYLSNVRKKEWSYIYGGKAVENCVAQGSLVLTDSGPKPIETVVLSDKIFDGVDFVHHGGVIYKSVQTCMPLNGLFITPDHEVLTNEGWTPAAEVASSGKRYIRGDLWGAYCHRTSALGRKETFLGVPLSLRAACGEGRIGRNERSKTRRDPELRMSHFDAYEHSIADSRNVETPSVRSMAVYDRPLSAAFASGVEELRGAWNNCVHRVAKVLRELLGGHGWVVPARAYSGPPRQRRGVFSGELFLGNVYSASKQPQSKQVHRYTGRTSYYRPSSAKIQNWSNDDSLSHPTWMAGGQAAHCTGLHESHPVYDIMNCGPRSSFTVLGAAGPFVVHNCVQALARIVLTDQMLNIDRQLKEWRRQDPGKIYQVVTSTYDEVVCCVPEYRAHECLQMMETEMATAPPWCSDLPLKSSGGFAVSYGDCEK